MFSGETVGVSTSGEKFPLILQDTFRLTLLKSNKTWIGRWLKLSTMPKGTAAAGSPLPVLDDGSMVFWGGVDALTRLHKDPVTLKGISDDILLYCPDKDIWEHAASEKMFPARVSPYLSFIGTTNGCLLVEKQDQGSGRCL